MSVLETHFYFIELRSVESFFMIINNLNEIPKAAGIYKLKNKINGKIYIGKAKNLKYRISSYRTEIRKRPVINAIQKYGWENFEVELLHWDEKGMEKEILLALETAFIIEYNSLKENGLGYNICLIGNDTTGVHPSAETREKMSKNSSKHNLGKPISEKVRQAIILSNKTRKYNSEKISKMMKGENNPNFDDKIYSFYHPQNKENFTGTRMAFQNAFKLKASGLSGLIRSNLKHYKGWIINQ